MSAPHCETRETRSLATITTCGAGFKKKERDAWRLFIKRVETIWVDANATDGRDVNESIR